MRFSAVALLLPALVSGHGFVQQIWLGDNLVDSKDAPILAMAVCSAIY